MNKNERGIHMQTNVFDQKHCGVTFGFYAKNGYFSSQKAKEEVDAIAETGANWVVLVVTVMQESYCATRQFRDFDVTPNDIELKEIIDYIHSKGIAVQLRPMLECFDGCGRLNVMFPPDKPRIPGLVNNHCSQWFDSMCKRSVYYARIAQLTGCEMFCLDSELDRIIGFNQQWKHVIQCVREIYSGPITSCHTVHSRVIDFEAVLSDKNHWFYDLDALSLSDYMKCVKKAGLSVDEIASTMQEELLRLRRVAALYGKPILFGEIGCTSVYGAAMHPGGWYPNEAYDEEEQANFLEAFLKVFGAEPWFYGMYWWKWEEQLARPWVLDPSQGDKGFTVRGKKAQLVMKKWYRRFQEQ